MQWLPLVRQRPNGERVIHLLRWGLVSSWAKDETIATRLINVRGIVPAIGFWEWQQVVGGTQRCYIHPVEGDLFALTALGSGGCDRPAAPAQGVRARRLRSRRIRWARR